MKKYILYFLPLFLFSNQVLSQQVSFERLFPDSFKSEFYATFQTQYTKGDLDNDGDIDLIIMGYVGGYPRTTIYLNDGSGNYTVEGTLPPVSNGSIELGDIDGDGDLDCVLSGYFNWFTKWTRIMINDGNANFSYSQNAVPNVDRSATILGDVDGDNDLDLFITGKGENGNIHSELYLNDGTGIFVLDTSNLFEKLTISDAIFIDVDNDSDLDIINTGQNISLEIKTNMYINDGRGVFTLDTLNTILGSSYGKFVKADLDNDGDMDFVLSRVKGGGFNFRTFLYRNNGTGRFSIDTTSLLPSVSNGNITVADLNNDNKLDLMFTGSVANAPKTQVYYNLGNSSFIKDSLNSFENIDFGCVIPVDINVDSFEDLLVIGRDKSKLSVSDLYVNDNFGNFNKLEVNNFEPLRNGVLINADIDGDQDEDLFMTGKDRNGIPRSLLYKNDGSGNFQLSLDSIIGVYDGESVFADIDLDLDYDLIVTGFDAKKDAQSIIYLNDGQGVFNRDTTNVLEGVCFSSIAVADLNNDGEQDIIIAGSGSTRFSTRIYFGNNGVFEVDSNNTIKDLNNGSVSVGDIDNDNDQDIFISGEGVDSSQAWNTGHFSFIYFNNGVGHFSKANNSHWLGDVSGGDSEFADLDNDGDLDIVYSGSAPTVVNSIVVSLNDGTGFFTRPRTYAYNSNLNKYQQFLTDLDNDNNLDLILNVDYISTVNLNDSLGSFSLHQTRILHSTLHGSSVYFDIDGDNDNDLLFTGASLFGSHSAFVYRNDFISKVGLEELKETKEYKLVPNPTNGIVTISDDSQEIKRVEVYSINGQLIFSNELAQSLSHQINLPDQNGIYILLIHAKDGQSAQRVVKY